MTAARGSASLWWVPACALLAGAAMLLPQAQRLSRPLIDAQQLWLSPSQPPEDVVVIDIDDASLAALRDTFGDWPYKRGVYALLIDALREAGAAAIAIDLLLADSHDGDSALARALARPGAPVVLGAAGLQPHADSVLPPPEAATQGGDAPASGPPPAQAWPAIVLPARSVWPSPDTLPRLGVITTPLDDDGQLRTLPLWHEAQGRRWPAMPLAVWQATHGGDASWPLTPQGRVWLALPSAAGRAPVWPLSRLVQLEAGPPGALAEAVRGRVVFIGSSALLADNVMTAGGQVTGTTVLAQAYAGLRDHTTLRLAPPWVAAVMLVPALVPASLTAWRRRARLRLDALAAALAVLAVLATSALLLAQARMPTNALPALTAIVVGYVLAVVARQRWLAQRQQRLEYENAVAEAASRAKSEFLANVSHEIRTPMNALLGVAELLAETPLSPTQRRHVDIFRQSGQALYELINDLLDISKIEAGRFEIEPEPFSLLPVLERLVALMRPRAEQKGLHLILRCEAGMPAHVVGDRKRLEQVLVNLLGNALKFTARGSVTLTVGADPAGLRFEVRDTGIGIAPSKLNVIFEPFTQADASTARHYGGTGLGLAISKNIVELMGGHIEVESQPGEGSVFRFIVPMPTAHGALAGVEPKPALPAGNQIPGLSVLLAEDNEVNVYVFEAMLSGTGAHIDVAPNGPTALDMARTGTYDLIFMDVQMPGMDGLTATSRLREFEARQGRRRVPVVALTANAFASDVQASAAAGCDAHLNKPYTRRQLLDVLARWSLSPPADESKGKTTPTAPPDSDRAAYPRAQESRVAPAAGTLAHAAVFLAGWSMDFDAARRGGRVDQMRALARDLQTVATNVSATMLADSAARLLDVLDNPAAEAAASDAHADVLRWLEPVIVTLTSAAPPAPPA